MTGSIDWNGKPETVDAKLGSVPSDTVTNPPPSFIAINQLKNLLHFDGNVYDLTRGMLRWDPEIAGAVSTYGIQSKKAYRGLKLLEKKIPPEEKRGNKKLLKAIKKTLPVIDKHFNFPQVFKGAAVSAARDGDVVIDARALDRLDFLPMKYVTAVEKEEDIGNQMRPAFYVGKYVVNEMGIMSQHRLMQVKPEQTFQPIVYSPEDIIHISVNPLGSEIQDNVGRWTFNVWSEPQLLPLRTVYLWKTNSIINDMLIRHKHVPRMLIQIDFESMFPALIEGDTPEDREEQAETSIQTKMTNIVKKSRWSEADQDLVATEGIEFSYLQPDNYSYTQPNELLAQFTDSITAVTGVTKGALIGDTRGNFASELVLSSYSAMKSEDLAQNIADSLLVYVKRVMAVLLEIEFKDEKIERVPGHVPRYRVIDDRDILDYITMDIRLLHKQDEDRLIKKASALAALPGLFPKSHIYETLGIDPDEFKYETDFYNIRDYDPKPFGDTGPEGGRTANRSPQDKKKEQKDSHKGVDYPDTPQQTDGKQDT